jgi:DNA-binding winged helix-turn-helix (wHTH) protein
MAESLSSSQQILRFGTFEVNPRSGELRKGGVRIKLHGQPFEVLAMLLERPGQVVTREELRLRLWPTDTFVNFDHGVNTAINKLREALGDSADNPRFVETLPRRGYRLLAGVEGQDRATAPEAVLPVGVTGRRAVAVLPFKLLTPNPEDDYLGVALADAVIKQIGGQRRVGCILAMRRPTANADAPFGHQPEISGTAPPCEHLVPLSGSVPAAGAQRPGKV